MKRKAYMIALEKLQRLQGKKVCVERKGQQSIIGYLSTNADGSKYCVWDTGATVTFDDHDIDFVEVNFIHLK